MVDEVSGKLEAMEWTLKTAEEGLAWSGIDSSDGRWLAVGWTSKWDMGIRGAFVAGGFKWRCNEKSRQVAADSFLIG
jgi:hypothetical protein